MRYDQVLGWSLKQRRDTHPHRMAVFEFDGPDDPRWERFLAAGDPGDAPRIA